MKNRWYVVVGGAAATVTGCGSSSQTREPPVSAAKLARSWMAPAAKNKDLLYISDVGTNQVYVFSYPQGSLVGTLSGFYTPFRECSDTAGNVYITNTNAQTILEYAHGGSRPIAPYGDKGFLPVDCSSTLIGPDGPNRGHKDAGFWKYPGGGAPIKTIGRGLFKNPSAAAISLAR